VPVKLQTHRPFRPRQNSINFGEEHGKEKVSFRCSDVGPKNCEWQISGNSEAEIMPKIEQHGREKHNMKIDEDTRKKVHSAIHKKAA
jgi:predicted small metal-binding protein